MHTAKDQRTEPHHWATLPQSLLELILITNTSTQDKRAVRQTCRLFRDTLDASMIFARLRFRSKEQRTSLTALRELLVRMQHVRGLILHEFGQFGITKYVFRHLPSQVTTLTLRRGFKSVKELRKLPCLTSLTLGGEEAVSGLKHITGLTQLECCCPVGSVAHLAPTLRNLSIREYRHVQDLDKLSNLEALKLVCDMNSPVFKVVAQPPLKHMWVGLQGSCCEWNADFCKTAPATLTKLTLCGDFYDLTRSSIPTQITHLQLFHQNLCGYNALVDDLPDATLPKLRNLDLHVDSGPNSDIVSALHNLCEMTTLQSFSFCIRDWDYIQMVAVAPDIAGMHAKGVQVKVVQDVHELHGVFSSPWRMETTWTTVS